MQDICVCRHGIDKLELYFEFYIYAQIHPNCFRRYNTEQLSNPICEYVEKYKGNREVLYRSCERIITRIVETHRMYFLLNRSKTCYKNMVHVPLYVAARIAFRCKLPNSKLVVRLLSEIYRCDQSMRKLIIGAYMKPQDCIGLCGTHPVFSSQEEGLQALRYFLHHANMEKKMFYSNGIKKRMVDLSLQIPCYRHPAVYSIIVNSYRTFKLLVEFGTNLGEVMAEDTPNNLLSLPSGSRTRSSGDYSASTPSYSKRGIEGCIRANHSQTGQSYKSTPKEITPEKEQFRILFLREHPVMMGQDMPCLMQFCRKVIRRQLYENFKLPCGIEDLPIPNVLKKYINLDFD